MLEEKCTFILYGAYQSNNTKLMNIYNCQGENDGVFKGVVVYRCLTKDILEGFWYEEYGDPKYLG